MASVVHFVQLSKIEAYRPFKLLKKDQPNNGVRFVWQLLRIWELTPILVEATCLICIVINIGDGGIAGLPGYNTF